MPSLTKLSLVASAFAVSASAHAHAHAHVHAHLHRAVHEKQQASQPSCGVVTATKTLWLQPTTSSASTQCGVVTKTTTIYGPSPVSSKSTTSSYKATSSSSVYVQVKSSSAPVVKAQYVAPVSSAKPAPSQPANKPTPYGGGSAAIAPNGNKWAMTYTPYNPDGTCRAASDVAQDLAAIASKGFTTVRIYGTDCNGVQSVGDAAKANGLKMIVGIWIDGDGIGPKTDAQIATLSGWGSQGNWGMVEMVVVGNEAIFHNWASPSGLANLISQVKSEFKGQGYTGLITTTEPLGTIQANGDTLCPVVDVISANIHPYFNAATDAYAAGQFVSNSLKDLAAVCNNSKDAYNLETGWPTQGLPNGLAIPGFGDQKTAIDGILSSAGSRSVFFSFADDSWKAPGDLHVEQYWGCSAAF